MSFKVQSNHGDPPIADKESPYLATDGEDGVPKPTDNDVKGCIVRGLVDISNKFVGNGRGEVSNKRVSRNGSDNIQEFLCLAKMIFDLVLQILLLKGKIHMEPVKRYLKRKSLLD
ncbi:hypothetical protein AMTR_s00018p00220660 [Amborella trichopoda]|uniref:Uncharacterized protein n=1 Tax=Amborella trichopoda TaxID=13333 RepID=W1PM73_AMBTC|nr:hypothetical protein AMTR_s00018p00220660 [Amborella trichopoda]